MADPRFGVLAPRTTDDDRTEFYLVKESFDPVTGGPAYALDRPGWTPEEEAERLESEGAGLEMVELKPTGTWCPRDGQWWKGAPDVGDLGEEITSKVPGILRQQ